MKKTSNCSTNGIKRKKTRNLKKCFFQNQSVNITDTPRRLKPNLQYHVTSHYTYATYVANTFSSLCFHLRYPASMEEALVRSLWIFVFLYSLCLMCTQKIGRSLEQLPLLVFFCTITHNVLVTCVSTKARVYWATCKRTKFRFVRTLRKTGSLCVLLSCKSNHCHFILFWCIVKDGKYDLPVLSQFCHHFDRARLQKLVNYASVFHVGYAQWGWLAPPRGIFWWGTTFSRNFRSRLRRSQECFCTV